VTGRAAIYLRISLDQTGERLAVVRQREQCRQIIEQRGWTAIAEYVDNSISASDARKNRPGYDALVKAYEAGEFDALMCYDLDRLTRQPRQLEDWVDAAEGKGLALVTANGDGAVSARRPHYGAAHPQLRARVAKVVASGDAMCWRCRQRVRPGERWHLGHADVPGAKAAGAYAGPEHAACLHTSGGWARQGVRRDAPLPPSRRARTPARALGFFDTSPEDRGCTA
jgi:hypothetical protein